MPMVILTTRSVERLFFSFLYHIFQAYLAIMDSDLLDLGVYVIEYVCFYVLMCSDIIFMRRKVFIKDFENDGTGLGFDNDRERPLGHSHKE